MLPRELNGVVDSNLRVYGTKNIRVIDLSIAPLQVAAHTQCKCPDWSSRLLTVTEHISQRLCMRLRNKQLI